MRIRALRISASTTSGDYRYSCDFTDGLNIIRGNNSSGKSTLFNSMIYALGMEELLGGKGEKVLPYALRDYIPVDGERYPIINSYVQIEISNSENRTITLSRAIRSDEKSSKLIEVIDGPYLTGEVTNVNPKPTYIHDSGSAINESVGYFKVLEKFIGLSLPDVPSTSGKEVKLYIQTLFSAFLIEQKRGWTDYIANIPYFKIKSAKSKVVEYLLNLDVFENDRERNGLNVESVEISQLWETERYKIKLIEDGSQILVEGVSSKPVSDFNIELVSRKKMLGDTNLSLEEYVDDLLGKIEKIKNKQKGSYKNMPAELVDQMEAAIEEVSRLSSLLETIVSEISLNRAQLQDYSETKKSLLEDLNKNKTARKLKDLGAECNIDIAVDQCPTCHQNVEDSLLLADTHVQPMEINANISYLDKQVKMLDKYVQGIENLIERQQRQHRQIQIELTRKKEEIFSIRRDMSSIDELSEADLRSQLRYEDSIKLIEKSSEEIESILQNFVVLSERFKDNKRKRRSLPRDQLSSSDRKKIRYWESEFKKMAETFGYKSADTKDIEINDETYLPFLSGLALRETNESYSEKNANINSDSSASDFVRLIWAYLLSVYDTSCKKSGNHPGIIAFDEPGQHSMADTSVNSMLKSLNGFSGLQSIIAASFDENDSVFDAETEGVIYNLIEVGDKLLKLHHQQSS